MKISVITTTYNSGATLRDTLESVLRQDYSDYELVIRDGGSTDDTLDICREYEFVDISPITKRGKGAMVASTTGAVVGGVGTITSAVANSDKIRDDNSEAGKKKEKDLNTASNVLSVGATAASATATVFNALQINAIKKVATVASECTGVLK